MSRADWALSSALLCLELYCLGQHWSMMRCSKLLCLVLLEKALSYPEPAGPELLHWVLLGVEVSHMGPSCWELTQLALHRLGRPYSRTFVAELSQWIVL